MPDSQILGVHHVSLLVADTLRSLNFYQGILGIKLANRPNLDYPGAWLQIGAQQIHLLELPNPDPQQGRPAHGGRDRHLALIVNDLDTIASRLDAVAIPYTRSRSGRKAIFCRDPDQNALELVEQVS